MKLITIAAAALFVAAPAFADSPLSLSVRHADLDLSDARDARIMLSRIRQAATEVCRANETGAESSARFGPCFRLTVATAVNKLGAPRVRAAYEAKGGKTLVARLP